MGFSRHWLRHQAFVLTKVHGSIDSRNLMEQVRALNRESDGIFGLIELVDCRELKDVDRLSVSGVTDASLKESKKPGSRLVILVPNDAPVIYGLARVYEMFAADTRDAVMVSTDLDEAVQWLENDEKKAKSILEFVNAHTCMPTLPAAESVVIATAVIDG